MLRPVRKSFVSFRHTQLQKSLMRSWEEVGVVCKEVRWRKGYRKYYCQKYLRKKYFCKNISGQKIVGKNIFEKNIFVKNIFQKNTYAKYFFLKKRWERSPPCCPQGLGWYRAIARSQPSIGLFRLTPGHLIGYYIGQLRVGKDYLATVVTVGHCRSPSILVYLG